jgi:3-oxoacyl-[acyl-carrier protein] reductase
VTEFASLEGRTALVTGGSRGIGKAIATELARAGATVVVGYRSGADEADAVAGEIGGRAVQADVSDPDQARRLVEDAGDVDILVNNAGITRDGLLMRMPDDDWRAVLDTNLGGVFHTCRAASRGMLRRRSGSIVNLSSVVGVHGNPGQTNYGAAKAGIIGFRTRRSAASDHRRMSRGRYASSARTRPRSSRAKCSSSTAAWGCR